MWKWRTSVLMDERTSDSLHTQLSLVAVGSEPASRARHGVRPQVARATKLRHDRLPKAGAFVERFPRFEEAFPARSR